MIDLINLKYNIHEDNLSNPKMDNFILVYNRAIAKINTHRLNTEYRILNTHFLKKLLDRISIDLESELIDTVFRFDEQEESVCRYQGINTDTNTAKVIKNALYDNEDSLWLNVDTSVANLLDKKWYEITPIKMIYSDTVDYNLNVPDKRIDNQFGLNVYTISIIELAYMYKAWYFDTKSDEVDAGIDDFISKILLPSIVPSIMECSLVNTVLDNKDLVIEDSYYTFFHEYMEYHMGYVRKLHNKKFRNSSKLYSTILENIKMFNGNDGLEWFRIPLKTKRITSSNYNIIMLARLPIFINIMKLLGKKGINKNRNQISDLRIAIERYGSDNTISNLNDNYLEMKLKVLVSTFNDLYKDLK